MSQARGATARKVKDVGADWLIARLNGKPFNSERWYVEATGRIVKTPI